MRSLRKKIWCWLMTLPKIRRIKKQELRMSWAQAYSWDEIKEERKSRAILARALVLQLDDLDEDSIQDVKDELLKQAEADEK